MRSKLSSSPPLGTLKTLKNDIKRAFLSEKLNLWQQPVAKKKYKEAVLVHHNFDLKKKWWVTFHAWDEGLERKVRKRLSDGINEEKTIAGRLRAGEYMVRYINRELAQGKVFNTTIEGHAVANFKKMTLTELLEWVRTDKQSKKYRGGYVKKFKTIVFALNEWYDHEGFKPLTPSTFTHDAAQQFFYYLRTVRKLQNKTLNNYRNDFITAINFIEKKKPGTFKINPLDTIELLPTVTKKHAAFSDENLKKILAYCKEHHTDDQFLLFIQFIYYTLGRPKEIRALRIHDLDVVNNRIYFRGESAKGKMDEYVPLIPELAVIIKKAKLLECPGDHLVFGNKHKPGPKKINDNYFWECNYKMLEALNIADKEYTLYGYKHTGAVALYRATKDIKLVQFICRHRTIEQTNTYLRDLGEMTNFEGLEKFRGVL